jgi:hypothetical protein
MRRAEFLAHFSPEDRKLVERALEILPFYRAAADDADHPGPDEIIGFGEREPRSVT